MPLRFESTSRLFCAFVTAAALVACGGGGGDDDGPAPQLQGVWDTTTTPGGAQGGAIVLEDGSYWGFSGANDSIDTLYQGTLTLTGNALASTNLRLFDLDAAQSFDASNVSGIFGGNTFSLNTTVSGAVSALAGTRTPSDAGYSYDTPAQLADLAGSWTAVLSTGDTGTVTVQANGSFASTTSVGCSLTGTATPRASGKNVFNIALTFGPAPCALPNVTAAGIAVASRATPAEPAVLVMMATTPTRNAAALLLAVK